MDDPATLLPIALEAVARATRIVCERAPTVVTAKASSRDMATDVDLAVEDDVRAFLQRETPQVSFLGEEHGRTENGNGQLVWALDPIDGTANFLHGLPLCAVSLGLVDADRPILGIIELPFLGGTYSAIEGKGAFRDDEPIQVSATEVLGDAIVSYGDYAVGENADEKNKGRLAITARLAARVQRIRMLGSAAIDLAWVAEGRLDAAVILANKPWDTAAGVLLTREAGALVFDRDGSPHTASSSATVAAAPRIAVGLRNLLH